MQTYFLFVIIPMILGLWAQSRIRSAYSKYSAVPTQYGMSGAQAARKMLDQAGLQNVQIERVEGTNRLPTFIALIIPERSVS